MKLNNAAIINEQRATSNEQRATSNEQPITISIENENASLVDPNFIYNRFDLWTGHEDCRFETLHVRRGNEEYYVQVLYCPGGRAELGIWLMKIPADVVRQIARWIFRTHPEILKIDYMRAYPQIVRGITPNHWRIELPETLDELHQRMSHKFKYNLKRERKMLESEAGPLTFEEYSSGEIPPEIFEAYFKLKEASHHTDYHMTGQQYIDAYHVTNAYAIRRGHDGRIISLLLSCEQCPVVFIENLTYDMNYAKYSPGKMIYHRFIESLVEKKKPRVFLAGGYYEYKTHYGSINEIVHTATIYRSRLKQCFYTVKLTLDKILPAGTTVKILSLIKRR